ncbi:glycosyltransferase family 2 protein [Candidatus Falkowbacteria bacterium]|nr:glycosyltransferase family 2 protein [Candidatus Falkowbacteria bacterium]
MKKISVIIPVYNEEGNIAKLHQEVADVCRSAGYEFEIIIIDDGSSDQTAEIAKRLSPVKLIRFRKNFGQTSSLDAGIKQAGFDFIITMDGDGQNDPADIPKMINYLKENNLDAVSGWRKNREDAFSKKLASRGADLLRRILVNDGIHDSGCALKVYRKECFAGLNLYGEMHRFIPAIIKIKGFKIGEIAVNHRPRQSGVTKYNWKRLIKGTIDLIAVWFWGKYAARPLHLLGGLGIFLLFLGIASSAVSIFLFFSGHDLSNTEWPLISVFFLIMGVQLFILGLMADMSSKNYYDNSKNKPYLIKEIIEN